MKSNIKVSFLVSIQIFLLLISFLSISYFQSSHDKLDNSILLGIEIRQLSDSLMFETEKYIGDVPYAKPFDMTFHLTSYLDLLKNGGTWYDEDIDPLDLKFIFLHDNASQKLTLYVDHLETSLTDDDLSIDFQNTNFLLLDNKKFDFNGSMDYLIEVLNDESKHQAKNLIFLEIGLAIINVGIHIFMILMILDTLNKESRKGIKLEKFATIGSLAARLAHDLRNPLTVIKGGMTLIELTFANKDETTTKRLNMINSAIGRMTHQINDVMDFVRVTELQLSNNSLLKLLKISISRITIPESVKIQLPENDIILKCDSIKLDIVFVNLISNAIDAIKKQGSIKIRLVDDSSSILIEIEDSGPKIKSDVLNNLFEPLFTTKDTGTGLGLASCKNIIEQHDGKISVKSEPTIFTVRLSKNL